MEDSFNPYTQWLGIAGARRRPNHYALLGLKLFESDAATIKAAAERRIAAVRATDATSREALRQRVLEELAAARLWLSDPDKKRRYDESLREQAQARSIQRPAETIGVPKPTGASSRPGVNLLPPAASRGPNRGLSPRGAAGIDALLPPTALDSDPMAPVVPGAAGIENPNVSTTEDDDLESQLPPPAYAVPAPHLPPHAAPPMSPASAPTAVASIDSQSVPDAGPSPRDDGRSAEISPQLATARKAAQRLAARRQRTQQWTIAALLVLIVSVAAGLWIAYANGLIRIGGSSSEVATTDSQENDASRETASASSTVSEQARNTNAGDSRNDDSKPHHSKEGTEDRSGDNSGLAPQNPPATDANASASDSDASTVRPVTDQKMTPPEPPPDPAQVAKFQSVLVSARHALGERKPDAAKERIAEAGELAASKEQKRLVASFEALQTHVAAFWEAVGEGMKGLREAGELQVGSTLVSVVEASKDTLVIRVNGQNRRYKADQLPVGVAVAIAKKWFDDRPDNKVILGAFYYVNPRSDVADAKRLWEEAAGGGVDVKDMLALLPLAIESPDTK